VRQKRSLSGELLQGIRSSSGFVLVSIVRYGERTLSVPAGVFPLYEVQVLRTR
jgi:hypothetical protein